MAKAKTPYAGYKGPIITNRKGMGGPHAYTLQMLLEIFYQTINGIQPASITRSLGIREATYHEWMSKHKDLQYAVKLAHEIKERRDNKTSMSEYIQGKLSPRARKVWKKISFWAESDSDGAVNKVVKLMEKQSKVVRQTLFIHALMANSFSESTACRMCGMSLSLLHTWKQDPDFARIHSEIHKHRKDFFEKALVDKVAEGDSAAILFVNRTINRDKGYGERLEVKVDEKVTIEHKITLSSIIPRLDVMAKKAVLKAIEQAKSEAHAQEQAKLSQAHTGASIGPQSASITPMVATPRKPKPAVTIDVDAEVEDE